MTVQTTFAKSGNPWAYISEPKKEHMRLTIDLTKLSITDANGNPIKLGKITKSSDFLDKMNPGYLLNFDPADHRRVRYLFLKWREKQPGNLTAGKFVKFGQMSLSTSKK